MHPLSTSLDNQKHNGRDDNPLILDHLDHDHDLSTDSGPEIGSQSETLRIDSGSGAIAT